ncbi:HD domain-containing protein [Rhodomicrobium vannielii ATCC 17100]|uniref:HD domain-containing protein n=1 Tax=Rhodomicrobium vannielii TaxID=1069 RepID=UPI0019183625|nr:HD domain-containing protein [Rhodomicrobium vannielii]MBJ7534779.1 HD domain-containing protein [Rhodomicrobium vannielii ATCC 17100]
MTFEEIKGVLEFLRQSERLKDVLRTARTSSGRPESTAEHSWRLCLMAMLVASDIPEIDIGRLLKICLIHDLGEAISGDIPAINRSSKIDKSDLERNDLTTLCATLSVKKRTEIFDLWEEYESASTPEAVLAKGLDKLETILQHTQGKNARDFNYSFNLDYGLKYTSAHPLLAQFRALLDEETRRCILDQKAI